MTSTSCVERFWHPASSHSRASKPVVSKQIVNTSSQVSLSEKRLQKTKQNKKGARIWHANEALLTSTSVNFSEIGKTHTVCTCQSIWRKASIEVQSTGCPVKWRRVMNTGWYIFWRLKIFACWAFGSYRTGHSLNTHIEKHHWPSLGSSLFWVSMWGSLVYPKVQQANGWTCPWPPQWYLYGCSYPHPEPHECFWLKRP